MSRFTELLEKLRYHDSLYYGKNTKEISDTAYDLMKEEARSINPDHTYFQEVGAPIFEGSETSLPYLLGSLDKVKSDKIVPWVKAFKDDVVASQKLDGISIMVTWEDGEVIFASTRGDGEIGQDLTEKAKIFVPKIDHMGIVSLRGEALLLGDDYKKFGFKNRRNGAGGILSRENVSIEAVRSIVPMFYEILELDVHILYTEVSRLAYIEDILELKVPKYQVIEKDNKDVLSTLNNMLIEAKSELYDVDGIVVTKNISEREDVMFPNDKVAFKVNTEAIPTPVKYVQWNLGRTGKITPKAFFVPQEIGGVTVSRATCFNYQFVVDGGIGTGAIVGLVRSGDVIPYITEVITPAEKVIFPTVCPECGSELVVIGVELMCVNEDCLSSNSKRIAHFFITLGAERITKTTIKNLGVSSIEEMYELDEFAISEIEGFGIKKGEQIVNEITKTLNTTPERLLAAFGMPGIGNTLSVPILKIYKFDDLFEVDDITDVAGVGEILSGNLVDNINNFKPLYEFLKGKGLKFMSNDKISGAVVGAKFALTGKAPVGRNEITNMIIAKGGIVKGISKDTDYLVTEDVDSGSIKNKKAQSYGTKIINFAMLVELLNE
jgi:DNA ligase (NAD+)